MERIRIYAGNQDYSSRINGSDDLGVLPHLADGNQNILAARITVESSDSRFRFSYIVKGRTEDTNFTFEVQEYATRWEIPVIGLYAKAVTEVDLTLTYETGETEIHHFRYDTTRDEYRYPDIYEGDFPFMDIPLHLDFEVYDQQMFEDTLGTGWMFAGVGTAYDKNGDLRMAGLYPLKLNPLQLSNDGFFYSGADIATDNDNAPRRFLKVDLLGNIILEYQVPEGHVVHHDFHADGKGHVYTLAGRDPATFEDGNKNMSLIYKFDDTTGELLWQRDYSEEFMGQYILENADTNDIHFNTLDYVPRFNQIITNSRSCNAIMGLDAETGDILWVIDNPSPVTLKPELALRPVGGETFIYGCGEHTTLHTDHPAFAEYNTSTKMAMTVFDNQSCKDEAGNFVERVMESAPSGFTRVPHSARALFYGLDFETRTVTLLNSITFEDQDSQYMGSVYEVGNYYITTPTMAYSIFIHDETQNIGVACYEGPIAYRSRIFDYTTIRKMLRPISE